MDKKIAITGGAGFLGSNLALRLNELGYLVVCVDDFSRKGSYENSGTLEKNGIEVIQEDFARYTYPEGITNVFHLAAQVTVTDSFENPYHDFKTNAIKTVQLLDQLKHFENPPFVVCTSTNKVYGEPYQVEVDESHPLVFQSPYALSKAISEQYVIMYNQMGVPGSVSRNSCIYGPLQHGIEGQGWIAYIAHRMMHDKQITVFGDGNQVRDVLHVSDWVEAMIAILERGGSGDIWNIGGGPDNQISVNDAIAKLGKIIGMEGLDVVYVRKREGDQDRYVSDIRKAKHDLSWSPKIGIDEGFQGQVDWIIEREFK
jgi:CDP-paratose 2-epimerase